MVFYPGNSQAVQQIKLAVDLYMLHGPMSDERLYIEFCEAQIAIEEWRVAQIRKALESIGLVERKEHLIATDSRACEVPVYGMIELSNSAAHD